MAIDPVLKPVLLALLRPTQMTIGRREVNLKRANWRRKVSDAKEKGETYLGDHMIPAVLGPKDRYFIVDHHHLALALLEEKVEHVLVSTIADLSSLGKEAFWFVMGHNNWMHAYDHNGKPKTWKEIPKNLGQLRDDPYRSLAGMLRHIGGFAKDTSLYSEFLWADYLRRYLKASLVQNDFDAALDQALYLARDDRASYLPGWCSR